MRHLLLLISFVLAGAAASASASGLGDKEIAAARKTYVAKCAKCHKFYNPKSYTEAEWAKWMASMSKKSNLNAEKDAVLRKYLEEYRAGKIQQIPH